MAFGQFSLQGKATASSHQCVQLTDVSDNGTGAAWHINQLDLTSDFNIYTSVVFGCQDGGGEGMVFALASTANYTTNLSQLGYGGMLNSIGVEFDTYQNSFDPAFDHAALVINGDLDHGTSNTLAGPVSISPFTLDVEDCLERKVEIDWTAATQNLKISVDCQTVIDHTFQFDVINTLFSGNSNVHWGFTASADVATNNHSFCLLDASFQTPTISESICRGDSVVIELEGGDSFSWSNTNGVNTNVPDKPIFYPTASSNYLVTLSDSCGRVWPDLIHIEVHDPIQLNLGPDTSACDANLINIDASVPNSNVNFLWNTGHTGAILQPSNSGSYSVLVTDGVCSARDTMSFTRKYSPSGDLGNDTSICPGSTLQLQAMQHADQILWNTGGFGQFMQVGVPGTYWIEATNECNTLTDTIHVSANQQPQVNLGADTILCQGNTLTLGGGLTHFDLLWNTGDSGTLDVSSSGLYAVTVANACGNDLDQIQVDFINSPSASLGPDTAICSSASLQFSVQSNPQTQILWHDGSSNDSYTVQGPGTFWVSSSNQCGFATDTIHVTQDHPLQIDLGDNITDCEGSTIRLEVDEDADQYVWQDGSTLAQIDVTNSGIYSVTVSNACGSFADSTRVTLNPLPEVGVTGNTALCEGKSVQLRGSAQHAQTASWSTGWLGPNIEVDAPGVYTFTATNNCGTDQHTVEVRERPNPTVTLPGDTSLCPGEYYDVLVNPNYADVFWSDGTQGSQAFLEVPGSYMVWVKNEFGCTGSDTITLESYCPPSYYVPSAFTPNGDGLNENWNVVGENIYNLHLQVFDRWGTLMFTTNSLDHSWDAGDATEGLYVWLLSFRDLDGVSHNDKGTVLLSRELND